ncbi:MAG: protein-glutamate O-methyltransferase CheR [Desulfatiglandales bacterium]
MHQLVLKDWEFQKFRRYVRDVSGINLHEGKKALLKARLGKIIRQRNFRSFGEYYDHVVSDKSGLELITLLNSISTTLTHFFREPQHFYFLTKKALPEILKTKGPSENISFWCAGCSSGEEAYSIAIAVGEALDNMENGQINILATDLSTKVLTTAATGIYDKKKLNTMTYDLKRKYFQKGENRWKGYFKAKKAIREKITFQRLNLMEEFQLRESFDVIFCRNVMIYFDEPAKEVLLEKLYQHLANKGYLFIGHSESLTGKKWPLKYIQPTIYRKI